jgi:hypothetical protein
MTHEEFIKKLNQLQEIVDMQQEALKYYADENHWKHIYSSGCALPSDRIKLWQPAQKILEKSKQIALKSDLPKVGSKWRDKKDHNYQLTVQEGICFTDNTSNLGYNLRVEDFLNDYEPIPTQSDNKE